ncbi:hypothetical protein [uncultured Treponema sp.]|uniref:hypothetical protein n=1 Tax=uncultured Treponema sp. TaxID=162155 RepID=UPI002593AB31|nr:hypothetical protein [uncultured Treponema sp.]
MNMQILIVVLLILMWFDVMYGKNILKKSLILPITLAVLAVLVITFSILRNIEEKKAEQIAAEKAEQMYYEEMFSQPRMNLAVRNPTIIIPAYNEMFILRHPELKEYFVREVSPQEIFSTKLNINFSDGTWQLSVDERTTELVKAKFSKDGKFILVSGIKEGNSIINISREDEAYNFSIFVKVEEPEEWYEKLQKEMKFEHLPMPTSQKEEVKYLYPNTINRAEDFPKSFFDLKTAVAFEVLENDRCIITISKGRAFTPGKKSNRYRLKIDESCNEQILDYFICPYSEFTKALEVFYKKTQQKKGTLEIVNLESRKRVIMAEKEMI